MTDKPRIGVLALQGAVQPHKPHIEAAGGKFAAVKTAEQIADCDALILPGGESSTMLRLIDRFQVDQDLRDYFAKKPVWGVCAGSILMADKVTNPVQKSYGLLSVTVERNAYGRQIDSHYDHINGYQVSFIRAPKITDMADDDITILARQDGSPVWITKGSYMATTFHPELNQDAPSPMHAYFMNEIV